ncbi:PAS domain S-box protein [Trichothermofontia sichuanensis B231]|uniref:PAS domain S-box protein n=1 Tax=Trichothermofontia sichuanensis TaxID=3045816 RepID=UPI0022476703|nr:PAS domain S-box protein [Trichothermofontia sichuanensis]UZQ52894.1 PAS domain S-box protein [Trichothermofontia sichuanensis B231]
MRLGQSPQGSQSFRQWRQSTRRSLLLGLGATIAILGLWQQLRVQEQQHLEQLVQQQVEAITASLGKQLSTHIQGLERMANRWEVGQGTPRSLWEADAKTYISYYPGFQAINWVDPNFYVRWIVPLARNEAVQNFNAAQESRRHITLKIARDLRQTLITRTIKLVQGGEGFLVCVPLFIPEQPDPAQPQSATGDRFDGWIVGVFRFSRLFDSILFPDPDYQVEIYDGTHLIYRQGEAQPGTYARTGVVHTYGADWQVKVVPSAAFLSKARSPLPSVVLWGGLALSWLLALAIDLSQRSQRQAQRVKQVNQQLQAEIQRREQVEASLRASEERWQLAIQGTNDGIWDWRVPTNEVFFSRRWKSMLGFADDEIAQHLDEWFQRIHPDDRPAMMAAIQAHFDQQTPFYLSEYRMQCKDGSYKWILDRGQALWDEAGNVVRMTGSHTDITKRKEAELALKESEARFQAFLQNAPLLAWIVDAEGILLYANPAFWAIVPAGVDAVIGQSLHDLFPAEFVAEYLRSNQYVLETGQVLESLEAAPAPDGSVRQYLVRKFPLRHQTASITWVGGVAFDITDRQQAEAALRQSEERFRQLAETIQDVFFIHSPDLKRIDYVSPAYESIWGRPCARLYAHPESWFEAIHPDDRDRIRGAIRQQVRGVPFQEEYRILRPDGAVRWIFSRAFPYLNEAGELLHYVGLASDITERKQAEITQQALIESIPDFLVRMRRDGLQLEILNQGAIHLIQGEVDAISGTWVTEIMPSDIAQERLALTEKALATREVQTQEYQFELNGQIIYEEARIAPLGTDEVLVVVRDITERHRSEEALRASEEKFRQLAENIHQVFFILSASGEMLYVSPAYEQIWQQSCDRLYQNPRVWLEPVHPEDYPRVLAALEQQINLQQPFDEVYRIIRPDGEIRWIAAQSSPIRDETGTVTRFVGIAEDITQQKQAEAALRQSEATKQAIIEAIPDLLMRMRSDGSHLEFISNTDFNVIHDLSQLGPSISLMDVLDRELAQVRLTHAQRAIATGQTQIYEHQICIDGQWHYEEIRIVPLAQDEVLVMIRNITDRKQAEIELLREKERFQAIVDHIPIMVTLFNEQGHVEFINPALERILGWSLAEWQTCDLVVSEGCPDPAYRQSILEHMLAATGQWRDIPIRTASGQQLETSWANVRLSDGRFLGIGQDITDRKHKEIALQQAIEAAEAANMAKSVFLANMSHELRTPLNVILGFTQIMAHDDNLTPQQREDLETIERSGDHLLSLINDILDLSKIEAGRYSLEITSFDLIALLHTLRNMMLERASSKGISLVFEIAPEVPQFVMADEKKLRQVLLNLLGNAVKFTQVGGVTLQVTAHASDPQTTAAPATSALAITDGLSMASPLILQFAVTDTGPGIEATELETIFEAFVQAEAGRKTSSGTGLGLAISRKLLELMGGQITVSSTLGVGSTFTLSLPIYPATGVSVSLPQDERTIVGLAPGQPHRRILVVDDQPENRLLIVRLLSQLGLEVREAVNGQEAVQLWREWQPDLIWMDIRMPILDGYEATRQIRALETEPASVIIALTAQASQSDRTLALAAGCNDYISKPFHAATLFLKMAEYLGLEYLYANAHPTTDAGSAGLASPPPKATQTIAGLQLATLPTPYLYDLEMAAARGDDRAIATIVAQLPSEVADIAQYLRDLAAHYQFEQIQNLIREATQNLTQTPTQE